MLELSLIEKVKEGQSLQPRAMELALQFEQEVGRSLEQSAVELS